MPISNPIFSILGYARLALHGSNNTNLSYPGPQIIICLNKRNKNSFSSIQPQFKLLTSDWMPLQNMNTKDLRGAMGF